MSTLLHSNICFEICHTVSASLFNKYKIFTPFSTSHNNSMYNTYSIRSVDFGYHIYVFTIQKKNQLKSIFLKL